MALRDREERGAERVASRQAERRVAGPARRVDAELVTEQVQRLEEERHGARLRADRHRERVDDHVLGRDPVVPRDGDDLLRDLDAASGLHRDVLGVREPDHGGAVLRDDRQDRVEPFVLAGDRVDERLPLVRLEASFERLDDGRVDAERNVRQLLNERNRLTHQRDFVGERVADVHVEHVGPSLDLLRDISLELREIAGLELGLECLPARGVDPLADDAERLLRTDDDGLRPRLDDGIHSAPSLDGSECSGAGRGGRCRPPCES